MFVSSLKWYHRSLGYTKANCNEFNALYSFKTLVENFIFVNQAFFEDDENSPSHWQKLYHAEFLNQVLYTMMYYSIVFKKFVVYLNRLWTKNLLKTRDIFKNSYWNLLHHNLLDWSTVHLVNTQQNIVNHDQGYFKWISYLSAMKLSTRSNWVSIKTAAVKEQRLII